MGEASGWWGGATGRRIGVPPAVVRWVEGETGRTVVRRRRLRGGLGSVVHDLTLDSGSHVVLRRYLATTPSALRGAARAIRLEAVNLQAVTAAGLPSPSLVAHGAGDGDGAADGADASLSTCLLMTKVDGRLDQQPADLGSWIAQLARTLAVIHGTAIRDAPPWERWMDVDGLTVPETASDPMVWTRAHDVVRSHPEPATTCFIHRDYQHFNVLWRRGRLAAVIDWLSGSIGPPDLDVGHCRLNLSVLFDTGVAERFRLAYEAESGRAVDPVWDLHSLLSYDEDWKRFIPLQVAGRAPLDIAGMTDRVERTVAQTLHRG